MLSICIYETNGRRNVINYVKQITNLNDNVVIDIDMGYGDTATKMYDKTSVRTIIAKIMQEVEE